MSLEDLRRRVLAKNTGKKVEVNQRALIDKILARYCTNFVVYRELLQNADDAKASRIEINFRTEVVGQIKERPSNSSNEYNVIEFKNNGSPFSEKDWDRLKKIAEGNPDEQKIGAFGVGFYSVFSLCEEPFVSSGRECMAFSWEDDLLIYRRDEMESNVEWTTILMNTREPMEIPDLEQFGNFLVTSMAFTENIREISVAVDDISKLNLSKKVEDSHAMDISKYTTGILRNEMFHLKSVNLQHVKIEATSTVITPNVNTISIRTAAGHLNVHVTKEFSAKMERIIKKKPPNETAIQMIFSEFNENENSINNGNIFKDLVPHTEQGKIFIGFPTSQTTGCSLHLAARVIPTVERESIDLAEITLAKYNGQMLSMAGVLSRILYDYEIKMLSPDWNNKSVSEDTKIPRAVHAFNQFTFYSSTPNKKVGELIESTFWSKSLPVVSSHGVLHIAETKLPNEDMEVFIKKIPTIPKKVFADCQGFFKKAKKQKMITEITLEDILEKELGRRTLDATEMTALILWWIKYVTANEVSEKKKAKFLDLAKLVWENKTSSLAKFKYFLNSSLIPPTNDFPVDMLPYCISKNIGYDSLKKHFGYKALPFLVWVEFMLKTKLQELESDVTFAETFLDNLKRAFQNMSESDKRRLLRLLHDKKIIPTKNGLRIPGEAYFPSVTLFPDLSTVKFRNDRSILPYCDLFGFLGVRHHVELGVLLKYLDDPEKDLDHMELVKYLTSIADKLKPEELKKLQNAQIWLREEEQDTEISVKRTRHKISELYAPTSELRGLALPIMEWKKSWLFRSKEANFLINLGLRTSPTLQHILALAAPPANPEFRRKAFDYFIKNKKIYLTEYKPSKITIGFLPCVGNINATPSDCFVNPECQIMGFKVLSPDYVSYAVDVGVSQDPPISELIRKLSRLRLKNEYEARKVFEYLANRQGGPEWKALRLVNFIPVKGQYVNPNSCFLQSEDERANSFLESCGVKLSPSAVDLARLLVNSSAEFWTKIGHDVEKYTAVLQIIATSLPTIRREPGLISAMQVSPILLGIKKVSPSGKSYCLEKANEIFLNDDETIWEIFGVPTCPLENLLEKLYEYLGSRRLRQCVNISYNSFGEERTSKKSEELESLIKDRADFLYLDRPVNDVNYNAFWVKQTLRVAEVQAIQKTYYLTTKRETQIRQTSCYLKPEFTLVTAGSEPDYIALAHTLSEVIYKKPKEIDVLSLVTVLTSSDEMLRRLCQVDRITKPIVDEPKIVDRHIVDEQKMVVQKTVDNGAHREMGTSAGWGQMPRFITERTTTVAQIYDRSYISTFGVGDNDSTIAPFESTSENSVTYRSRGSIRTTESISEIQHVIHNLQARRPMPMTLENTTILTTDLQKAIRSCKSNSKSDVHSQTIEGLKSYCDAVPRNSLKFVRSFAKMDVYATANITRADLKKKNLNTFVKLLKALREVFGHELSLDAIHVFYDADGESDAFNHNQALFFNLHYFDASIKALSYDLMVYWFISFCHVLAHNFEKSHNSKHSFYFSSYARNYIPSLYTQLQQLGLI
ncbi:9116_t:CDS:10 [Paraglomus occultum]|uniref:9116_t:CDS:1 n=1 Tax=Paraglomus occultum TaxID=144539 RepID=A0A9N9FKA4_9GLOM|nr:9116_t:CDS:10 [Paraglomus occultum]